MAGRAPSAATAADRERTVRATGGSPLVDFDGQSTPYIDYASIDALLALQHPSSPSHDEMTFYISGQVMELLFKLAVNEVQAAQLLLDEDQLAAALKLLRRTVEVEKLLVRVWAVLDTLSANDFNSFRDYLGTASGFQSYMYRHLEFCLGNKNPLMLRPHRRVPDVYPELLATFHAPSLWDTVTALLARRGHEIDPDHLARDFGADYIANPSVEAAWLAIYRRNEPNDELYQLGEVLMAVASTFTSWRMTHLLTVERLIGFKVGTGGTTGAGWLRSIVDHRFFPELWTLRTQL